jgi:predicted Zn-dependent protease
MEKSTAALEKAVTLDPRNPELLEILADQYSTRRRYRDFERVWDRLIQLKPDDPMVRVMKIQAGFMEKGDLKTTRAEIEALPAAVKDDSWITIQRCFYAMCDRDFATAHEIVSQSPHEEIFFAGAIVPRHVADIWLDMVEGNHPSMEEYGKTREQLYQKVEADPTNPILLSALACADIGLSQKKKAIEEARRALEMRPISEDQVDGPSIALNLALVYAWAGESDLAFEQLNILMKVPGPVTYGELKIAPHWDPLRKDPRFEKLLAELAPRD